MKRCHIPGLSGGLETQGEETICMRRFKDQINIWKRRHNQTFFRYNMMRDQVPPDDRLHP